MASKNKNVYIDCTFHAPPVAVIDAGTAATGADTSVTRYMHFGGGSVLYNTGTNTGRIVPSSIVDANCTNGWYIPSTDSDNVGGTWSFGGSMLSTQNNDLARFTVGTDPAFFCEIKIGIPDISDYDVLGFGFVEPAAAHVAAIDTTAELVSAYDEKAMIGLGDNAGDIDYFTSLAGSDTDTDVAVTAWADDAVKTLKLAVSSAGVVTPSIDGTAIADAHAFTFADTTVVQPVLIFAKGAAVADTPPIVNYIKWGYQ